VLKVLRANRYGQDASIIGEIPAESTGSGRGRVFMKTAIGGTRIIDMLAGEQLPRIC